MEGVLLEEGIREGSKIGWIYRVCGNLVRKTKCIGKRSRKRGGRDCPHTVDIIRCGGRGTRMV